MTAPLTPPAAINGWPQSAEVVELRRQLDDLRLEASPWASRERGRLRSAIRNQRLKEARAIATHTEVEWKQLVARFNGRCVRCGREGGPLDKDHITPIYQGGSDGIANLQPMCPRCNSSKGPENKNWVAYREAHGFEAAA